MKEQLFSLFSMQSDVKELLKPLIRGYGCRVRVVGRGHAEAINTANTGQLDVKF